MKNWRNNHPSDDTAAVNDFDKTNLNNKNSELNSGDGGGGGVFPQQNNGNDETLSVPMYTLIILTLIVILLFFSWYRKGRNNIRTRRKYFLFNKLGF